MHRSLRSVLVVSVMALPLSIRRKLGESHAKHLFGQCSSLTRQPRIQLPACGASRLLCEGPQLVCDSGNFNGKRFLHLNCSERLPLPCRQRKQRVGEKLERSCVLTRLLDGISGCRQGSLYVPRGCLPGQLQTRLLPKRRCCDA